MTLPVNIDSTYADTGGADVALHQQHHDKLHAAYNHRVRLPLLNRGANSWDLNYALPGWAAVGSAATLFANAGQASTVSEVYFTPILVTRQSTFDQVGVSVHTAAAGSTVRLGLYAADSSTLMPAARLYDWGTVGTATTGDKVVAISVTLAPGVYWLAHAASSASVLLRYLNPSYSPPFTGIYGDPWGSVASVIPVRTGAGTPAASGLPSPAGTMSWPNTGAAWACVFLRYDKAA